MRKTAFGCFVF